MKWDNYYYFYSGHYVHLQVEGTKEECLESFEKQKEKFPMMQYGTHIHEKDFSDPEDCYVVIRRFVDIATCQKHCTFPPTYKREGRTIE